MQIKQLIERAQEEGDMEALMLIKRPDGSCIPVGRVAYANVTSQSGQSLRAYVLEADTLVGN